MRKYEETFEAILGPVSPRPSPPEPPPGPVLEDDPDIPERHEPNLRDAIEHWVDRAPVGVVAVPTYVSDLVLKNLSLAEQSVFQRLFRLAGGFAGATARIRPAEIGKACGLRGPLVTASVKALIDKGLVTRRRRNPITGSARYLITLPDTIRETLKICCVCHRLIETEEDTWLPIPISMKPDGTYQYASTHAECLDGATL